MTDPMVARHPGPAHPSSSLPFLLQRLSWWPERRVKVWAALRSPRMSTAGVPLAERTQVGTDQHVVLSDGLRVSYREAGVPDGPVVLYLHGTPGSRMQVTGPLGTVAAELGLRLIAPDRPGYGGSDFVRYRVVDYPAMIARFADSLGIDRFGVVGTSGGGRYAYACGMALKDRIRRVALVASTAPSDLLGVAQTWSKSDRRLYTMATKAPWLLRASMARTARSLSEHSERMLTMLPDMSKADERAVARADVQALIRAMTAEAFRQGGRGFVHDVRLEALPWGFSLDAIAPPVDVWHGRDDTIVRCEQAQIMADAIPGVQRRFVAGEGHFSLVMLRSASYLGPFR
jgi:pimeloyl-ACP methyl ester carboxylesterase